MGCPQNPHGMSRGLSHGDRSWKEGRAFLKDRPAAQIKASIVPETEGQAWSADVFAKWQDDEVIGVIKTQCRIPRRIACRSLFRAKADRFVRAAPNRLGVARRALSSIGMAGVAGVRSPSPTPAKSRLSAGGPTDAARRVISQLPHKPRQISLSSAANEGCFHRKRCGE